MPSEKQYYSENPYDLETVFESLYIAEIENKELLYIDRLIMLLRDNPKADLININYSILNDLKLMKLEPAN